MKQSYTFRSNDVVVDNADRQYILRVRDLADEDKPRERLVEYGPSGLSASELLAIVLNTGTKKEEIMTMSARIMREYGEKALAAQTDPRVVAREFGITLVKACQIVACFELGRRFFQQTKSGATIRTAKQAFEYLKDMRDLPKEYFRGIYLNSHYRVVHDEVISVGSLTASIVHPREVFRPAVDHGSAAIIVAHNHPSGSTKPTQSDIELTKQLTEAGKILGIDLLDHLVITKQKFVSILTGAENNDKFKL